MDKPYEFSSTQVQMSPDVCEEFLELGKGLINTSDLFGDGFELDPHITILYGIHEEYPTPKLIDIVETYPKFTVTLGDVSMFNDENFDVIKVDIECNDLYVLYKTFMNNCYFTLTHPEYIPHATIAFVKPDTCDHLVGNPAFRGLSFVVDSITFSCSDGTKRKIMLGVR